MEVKTLKGKEQEAALFISFLGAGSFYASMRLELKDSHDKTNFLQDPINLMLERDGVIYCSGIFVVKRY